MEIFVASKNKDKIEEIRRILKNYNIKITSLLDIDEKIDIIEDGKDLNENALKKAEAVYKLKKGWVIGEDTGLEVNALNGKPGVFSARYSGGGYRENRLKLLKELEGVKDRTARFRTVIALITPEGKRYFFEGIVEGRIGEGEKGENGFGYDPIFIPEGSEKTFGEMEPEEKDKFSHRRKALEKLAEFFRGVAQLV
uniref:dITP/XTP pyrophosphatase n=1 Tax=candidate division WOR-3 bacterium TaxID=2052148 RepID=A0A7C4UBA5_UNCW3